MSEVSLSSMPKKKNLRLLVFTATYNEVNNIDSLLNGIWAALPEAEILVVDDNSPDGTGKVLMDLASLHKNLKLIHRPGKLGLGSAHYLAMLYAIRNQYDVLVTLDADLSHDPLDIPRLIANLEGVDFVIGSRYMKGGSCDYSGYRKYLSVIGNYVVQVTLGIPLKEFTTSFRVFDVNALSRLKFDWIGNFGYSFFLETVYRLNQAGFKMKEVPIRFYNRHSGVSKIPKLEILRAIRKVLSLSLSNVFPIAKNTHSQIIDGHCMYCGGNFLYLQVSPGGRDLKRPEKEEKKKCLQCGQTQ